MKRLKNIFWLLLPLFLFIVLYVFELRYHCPFKTLIHIPCPGCGMTRAIKLIINGKIMNSFHYHIMAIPLCIIGFLGMTLLLKDFINNQTKTLDNIERIFEKHYKIIFLGVFAVWLINTILNGKRL